MKIIVDEAGEIIAKATDVHTAATIASRWRPASEKTVPAGHRRTREA
ncbi:MULTISPECIES: hypothetical protein [Bradyrhizobium]|nr:hypothetical protein [Bradyrhizobium elkanii]